MSNKESGGAAFSDYCCDFINFKYINVTINREKSFKQVTYSMNGFTVGILSDKTITQL